MPFYKCKIITPTYNIEEEIVYIPANEKIPHSNIISCEQCRVHINFKGFALELFRILHRLISNKYNTVQALTVAVNCFSGSKKAIIQYIIKKIHYGVTFSDVLRQFPQCFDATIIEILRASEVTGRLSETIDSIIKYLEYKNTFNTKIRNATRYPIFVLSLIFIISIIWIVWIIPQFGQIFIELEIPTPTITRWMLHLSNMIRMHYIISFILLVLVCITFRQLRFKIPIISKFINDINKLQFFDTLALILYEKVHLTEAIKCVTEHQEFKKYYGLLELVMRGDRLSVAAEKLGLFSKSEIAIISVSEQTGQYWLAFRTFADIVKLRIENNMNVITKKLPSILICIVGIVLIIFIYGTFMPLYSTIDIISRN